MKKLLMIVMLLTVARVNAVDVTILSDAKEYGVDKDVPRFELVNKSKGTIWASVERSKNFGFDKVWSDPLKIEKPGYLTYSKMQMALETKYNSFKLFIWTKQPQKNEKGEYTKISEAWITAPDQTYHFNFKNPKTTLFLTFSEQGALKPQTGQLQGRPIKTLPDGRKTAISESGYALINNVTQAEIDKARQKK